MSWRGKKVSGPCAKCDTFRERLQCDHVIPRWKGGSDEPENLQFLCANCHEDKTRAELRERHLGRKHSADHVAKIARANTGQKRTPEQRERMRAAAIETAKRRGPEHFRAMRAKRAGHPWSADRRARYEAKRAGKVA